MGDLHMTGEEASVSKAISKPEFSGSGGQLQMTGEQADVSSTPIGFPFDKVGGGDLHMTGEQAPVSSTPSNPWNELPVATRRDKA